MKPSIIILRVAFTIAIIDEGFKGAKFERVKSSVVNAKSYIHSKAFYKRHTMEQCKVN